MLTKHAIGWFARACEDGTPQFLKYCEVRSDIGIQVYTGARRAARRSQDLHANSETIDRDVKLEQTMNTRRNSLRTACKYHDERQLIRAACRATVFESTHRPTSKSQVIEFPLEMSVLNR